METLTVRQLDPEVKQGLRVQAAENGRSMEAEARAIITGAVVSSKCATRPRNVAEELAGESLVRAIRDIVEPVDGIELDIPEADGTLPDLLLRRAAENKRSLAAEIRCILEDALTARKNAPEENLAEAFQRLVDEFGSADLVLPPREPAPPPVRFE